MTLPSSRQALIKLWELLGVCGFIVICWILFIYTDRWWLYPTIATAIIIWIYVEVHIHQK